MEAKNTRVFPNAEVQIHGGSDGDSFGNWWWVPFHGLPEIESGKEVVILHPCDCGCWNEAHNRRAMDVILKDKNPERFVLVLHDDRYHVSRDSTHWFIADR